MKTYFLFLVMVLTAFSGYSQKGAKTVGLIASPNVHFGSYHTPGPKFQKSAGLFYDHNFTRRIGLNTGLQLGFEKNEANYRQLDTYSEKGLPDRQVNRHRFIELPVNLTYCLNPDPKSGFRTYLFSGILLNRLLYTRHTAYYPNEVIDFKRKGYQNGLYADSYMNFGVEVRKQVCKNYLLAIGTNAKFRPAHSFDFSSDFRDPVIFNLNLKFGRSL